MAFDPLYASTPDNAGPGRPRPVNLRRDIGVALGQMPSFEPSVQGLAPITKLPQESSAPTDYRTRATAAANSIASSIDPNTPSAFGQFAGGLARGFAGVQNYLHAVTGQQEAQVEHRQDRALAQRKGEADINATNAQADYYRAGVPLRGAQAAKAAEPKVEGDGPDVRQTPNGPIQRKADGSGWEYVHPSGTPTPRPQRPLAPQLRVGADGFQYEMDPRTHRWVQSLDAQGQPFKPRPAGNSGRAPGGFTPRPQPTDSTSSGNPYK
jgi:hypothetical protein